jgi:hypothetical protein
MTFEARLAFIVFFFLCWTIVALLPWAVAAIWVRGRGALLALPLAVVAAWAAGVFVPLVGWRDAAGFFISLLTALIGGAGGAVAGIAFARRLEAARSRPAAQPRARLER